MPERHRSKDGTQETREYTDAPATPSQQDRAAGELERRVGTRDELKQDRQGEGSTRVTKGDQKGRSNVGGGGQSGTGNEER